MSLGKKKPTCPVSAHADLMVADRREPRCRSAPAPVWCLAGTRSCAFCPPSDTVPPSSAGLCHRTGSTGREERESVGNGPHCSSCPSESWELLLLLLPFSHRAPLCCEPLRFALAHLTLLHQRRFVQMCTLAGLYNGEIASCLLDANDVSALCSVPTWNIALNKR